MASASMLLVFATSHEGVVMGTPWVMALLFVAGAVSIGWTVLDIVRDVRGRS
jgi:hypothetical protein